MASTTAAEYKQKGNAFFKAGQLARCVRIILLMKIILLIAFTPGLSSSTPR